MRRYVNFSTVLGLLLAVLYLSEVAAADEQGTAMPDPPLIRMVTEAERPETPRNMKVRLIADEAFPPFSFISRTGAPSGLAVELAIAACERAQLDCTVEARAFDDILPALLKGEADVAITGPQPDAAALQQLAVTRPYFRIMGRFAAGSGNELKGATPSALSRARIGVAKDTLHARWLEAYYGAAYIVAFDSLAAAGEALKKGDIDALFGDNLQVIYWVSGEEAAGCCRLLDGAFSDFDYFSRDLVFLVRRNLKGLGEALDYGLDQAQATGATSRIIRAYLPLPLW